RADQVGTLLRSIDAIASRERERARLGHLWQQVEGDLRFDAVAGAVDPFANDDLGPDERREPPSARLGGPAHQRQALDLVDAAARPAEEQTGVTGDGAAPRRRLGGADHQLDPVAAAEGGLGYRAGGEGGRVDDVGEDEQRPTIASQADLGDHGAGVAHGYRR